MSRMLSTFYKANLFTFWASRLRRGVGVILARHLGKNASTSWADLSVPTRGQLERYGFNDALWNALRSGAREVDDIGPLVTLDAARLADPQRVAAGLGMRKPKGGYTETQLRDAIDELELRLQSYFNDQADTAMTEPRARERAAIRLGTRAGTPADMAVRLFMQFKSFPTTVITRQLKPALTGAAGLSPWATTAHLLAATVALGFVAMQTKMLARGVQPRPVTDEDGDLRADVFLAAFLQGGGAGIYGDLLMADYNRYGQGLADTLGGPTIGEATALAGVLGALRDDALNGEVGADPGARLVGLIKRNIPFGNLFYTKAALDYLFIHQMQEWASPGYMDRYRDRLQEDQGTDFLFPPER